MLRVFVVFNHKRDMVHGVTVNDDKARQWHQELLDRYDSPLAVSTTVALVEGVE